MSHELGYAWVASASNHFARNENDEVIACTNLKSIKEKVKDRNPEAYYKLRFTGYSFSILDIVTPKDIEYR